MKSVAEQCACCGGDIILVGDIVVLKPDATYATGGEAYGPNFLAEKQEDHKRPLLVLRGHVREGTKGPLLILNAAWSSDEFVAVTPDDVIKIGSVWDLPWPEPFAEKGGSDHEHV